jgi:hypothetical protein
VPNRAATPAANRRSLPERPKRRRRTGSRNCSGASTRCAVEHSVKLSGRLSRRGSYSSSRPARFWTAWPIAREDCDGRPGGDNARQAPRPSGARGSAATARHRAKPPNTSVTSRCAIGRPAATRNAADRHLGTGIGGFGPTGPPAKPQGRHFRFRSRLSSGTE